MHILMAFGLALSLTEVANSQGSPSNMPPCVSSCIASAFAGSQCTFKGLQNWPCACSTSSFQSSVNSCFNDSCSADNASIGQNQVDIECSNAISSSIPPPFSSPTDSLTTTTETSSGIASTATSTVTPSSSVTTSSGATSTSSESESESQSQSGPRTSSGGQLTPPIPPTSGTTPTQGQPSSPTASTTSDSGSNPGSTPTSPLTSGVASSTSNSVGTTPPNPSSGSPSTSRTLPGATTITSTLSSGTIQSLPTNTTTSHAAQAYGSKSLTVIVIPLMMAMVYLD